MRGLALHILRHTDLKNYIERTIFYRSLISFVEFYNRAVEIAPMISPDFASDVAEGTCWSKNHLRSYFRAVHGQANTLRKMGRYKEALKKYLLLEKLDPNFHKYEMISKLIGCFITRGTRRHLSRLTA